MLGYIYKKLNNRKGFSLIELIVVIGILGILAAVAIPRVTQSLAGARTSTDNSNLRTLINAVELHNIQVGSYPTATNRASFEAAMTNYLADGVPVAQVTGNEFYYNAGAVSEKIRYAADAAACVAASPETTDVDADWINISN